MRTPFFFLIVSVCICGAVAAAPVGAPLASELDDATEPSCTAPSHDRLEVRAGRDACASAVDAGGRPRSVGYMPTECLAEDERLIVDADGHRDLCVAQHMPDKTHTGTIK